MLETVIYLFLSLSTASAIYVSAKDTTDIKKIIINAIVITLIGLATAGIVHLILR